MRIIRWLYLVPVAVVLSLATACEAPGVGDPCDPESVPANGFVDTEVYLETSSVQCRTRVCMVYKLSGAPNRDNTCTGTSDRTCASPSETEDKVYCTCRCNAPGSATTCECPDGFSCEEILDLGGDGIRGSYCVRSSSLDPN